MSLFESSNLPWGFVPGYYDFQNGMTDLLLEQVTSSYSLNSYQSNPFTLYDNYLSNGFTYYLPINSSTVNG
jgi:hypothetical protein